MARHEYWTHGVDTIVEFPDRATEIRHAGWGTRVRQAAHTDNWLHIALPSGKVIHSEDAIMREVRLRAEVNDIASVDLIQFRDDEKLVFSKEVSFTDRPIDQVFQRADLPLEGALTLCVHVTFLTGAPIGQVIVRSAGAAFLT